MARWDSKKRKLCWSAYIFNKMLVMIDSGNAAIDCPSPRLRSGFIDVDVQGLRFGKG